MTGRLPLVRGSFRVDQQATLDASESGVPVVNGDRSWWSLGWSTKPGGCDFPFYPNPRIHHPISAQVYTYVYI